MPICTWKWMRRNQRGSVPSATGTPTLSKFLSTINTYATCVSLGNTLLFQRNCNKSERNYVISAGWAESIKHKPVVNHVTLIILSVILSSTSTSSKYVNSRKATRLTFKKMARGRSTMTRKNNRRLRRRRKRQLFTVRISFGYWGFIGSRSKVYF